MPDGPEVFISYRVLDNHPPPDGPARGFVDYLLTQIRYDLTQLGIPDAILWQDRSKIAPADDWNDNILSALNSAQLFIAILSKNYITSDWCNKELDTMTSRVETLDAGAPGATPQKSKGPGVIDWQIRLKGDALVYGVDIFGNKGAIKKLLYRAHPLHRFFKRMLCF